MPKLQLPPKIQPILENIAGKGLNDKIARLLAGELRRCLSECEQEILQLEIKYGCEYEEFKEQLRKGRLGDEFAYPLEQDAMRWEDLVTEKRHGLKQLKIVEEFKNGTD